MSFLKDVKPKEAHKAIKELQNSLAWALIKEHVERDVRAAVFEFGSNPTMEQSEVHYRRGKINATEGFLTIAEKLETYYENQAVLDQAPK